MERKHRADILHRPDAGGRRLGALHQGVLVEEA
jgi:hypothetical protein